MSEQLVPKPPKPLSRLQDYLVESKKAVSLFKDLLVEVKDLLVVVTLILFFIVGVCKVLF